MLRHDLAQKLDLALYHEARALNHDRVTNIEDALDALGRPKAVSLLGRVSTAIKMRAWS